MLIVSLWSVDIFQYLWRCLYSQSHQPFKLILIEDICLEKKHRKWDWTTLFCPRLVLRLHALSEQPRHPENSYKVSEIYLLCFSFSLSLQWPNAFRRRNWGSWVSVQMLFMINKSAVKEGCCVRTSLLHKTWNLISVFVFVFVLKKDWKDEDLIVNSADRKYLFDTLLLSLSSLNAQDH